VALEAEEARWQKEIKEKPELVDEEKIAEVVAMISGVPVQRIAQAEGQRLLEMKDQLKGMVIGQDEAVEKVVKAIQRNRGRAQRSEQADRHVHVLGTDWCR